MKTRSAVAVLAPMLAAGLAGAQEINPVAQVREIAGQWSYSDPASGQMLSGGPETVTVFDSSYYGDAIFDLPLTGPMSVNGQQQSGWDFNNSIFVDIFSTSIGGGGPPTASGTASVRNTFSMTFTLSRRVSYTLSGSILAAQPTPPFGPPGATMSVSGTIELTGAGGAVIASAQTAAPEYAARINASGTLEAGTYTLKAEAVGSLSVAGTGHGGGSGQDGPRMLAFTVAPIVCTADFDTMNGVQVADIFAFLRAWFANSPSADFDQQNGIQVADIFAFLRSWFAGCP